jgi:hypothetical protein
MSKIKNISRLSLVVLIVSCNFCVLINRKEPNIEKVIFKSEYSSFKGLDFTKEISKLQNVSQKHPDLSVRSEAHLHLAIVYLHPRNPKRDYDKSIQEFNIAKKSIQDKSIMDEMDNWLSLLKQIIHDRDRLKQNDIEFSKLLENNRKLKKELFLKVKEIKHLRAIINKLDSLYFKIEKKKKKMKTR